MRIGWRLLVPLAAVLIACAVAHAQPVVAPEPHPALNALVTEYKRLGLPFLPPNAELVRIKRDEDPDDRSGEVYDLAYRVPGAQRPLDGRFFTANFLAAGFRELELVEPDMVEEIEPTPEAFQAVQSWDGRGLLTHAVQCKERGWNDLAAHLYLRARERLVTDEASLPVFAVLRDSAWKYWENKLFERDSDRRTVLHRLEALASEDPEYKNNATLNQLRLTLAPSKAKPGTAEALIDGLTEYWDKLGHEMTEDAKPASYWELAALGFDAVPALIEHLDDDRLTRVKQFGIKTVHRLTVGRLCGRLLSDLSAGGLRGSNKAADTKEWFVKAKRDGEEKWLFEHAVPVGGAATPDYQRGRSGCHLVRALGARFPERLPEAYRAVLKVPCDCSVGPRTNYADVIVTSRLPREQKLALLEEGAASGEFAHRIDALGGLAALEQHIFRKHLVATLQWAQFRAWFWGTSSMSGERLVPLVERAGDRACWAHLAGLCRCDRSYGKVSFLWGVCGVDQPLPEHDPHRLERVRFLALFLNDAETIEYADGTATTVGDQAAARLGGLLGLRCVTPSERYFPVLHSRLNVRGTFSRAFFRAAVWQAAVQELAAKP